MDPMTMAAAAQGVGSAIGAAMGGPVVSGAPVKLGFDSSGWSVATAGSKASATATKNDTTDQTAGGMGNGVGDWVKWVLLAVVAVAAIKALKRGAQ